jgi:hypothetical protein
MLRLRTSSNFDPAAETQAVLLIPEWARDDAASNVSGMIRRRFGPTDTTSPCLSNDLCRPTSLVKRRRPEVIHGESGKWKPYPPRLQGFIWAQRQCDLTPESGLGACVGETTNPGGKERSSAAEGWPEILTRQPDMGVTFLFPWIFFRVKRRSELSPARGQAPGNLTE